MIPDERTVKGSDDEVGAPAPTKREGSGSLDARQRMVKALRANLVRRKDQKRSRKKETR